MEPIYEYTIKLIRYVLNGDVPELPDNIDFEKLFTFGRSHDIENMLYVGLRDLNISVPDDTMQKFEKAYKMAIMIEAKQAFELEAISEAFEEAGIDYIPLKGSVIKHLYPMPDYRKSGDIDILFKPKNEEKINHIMNVLGYNHIEDGDTNEVHLTYDKSPYIEIEMHRRLTRYNDRASAFCEKAWKYAIMDEKNKCCYHFTNEFLYIHAMAHLCKHLYFGGAGIKLITDLWVMKNNLNLNNKLLKKFIKKSNLQDLNSMINKLIAKWFENEDTDDEDIKILEYIILTGGSFGTAQMRKIILDSNSDGDKLRKFLKEYIFISRRLLIKRYPQFEGSKLPTICIWFYRLFNILFVRRNLEKDIVKESFDSSNKQLDMKNIVKAIRDK